MIENYLTKYIESDTFINKSIKQEMQQIAEEYLFSLYPTLDISKLVYKKYGDWFYIEKGEVKLKECE